MLPTNRYITLMKRTNVFSDIVPSVKFKMKTLNKSTNKSICVYWMDSVSGARDSKYIFNSTILSTIRHAFLTYLCFHPYIATRIIQLFSFRGTH